MHSFDNANLQDVSSEKCCGDEVNINYMGGTSTMEEFLVHDSAIF